jgi:hypothetical protein
MDAATEHFITYDVNEVWEDTLFYLGVVVLECGSLLLWKKVMLKSALVSLCPLRWISSTT